MPSSSDTSTSVVAGDAVVLTRSIPGAVKGARATVVSVHAKPRFNPEAYSRSELSSYRGEPVVDLRLQTNALLENIPLNAIRRVS